MNNKNNIDNLSQDPEFKPLKVYNEPEKYLYARKVNCPVCDFSFTYPTVKKEGFRIDRRDSDLYITYSNINPYLYAVVSCPKCGYSALKADFDKLRSTQIETFVEKIASKYRQKELPYLITEEDAISRHKLALLTSTVISSPISTSAVLCLRIAWINRSVNNTEEELLFLKKALVAFEKVYLNETLPVYGFNKHTLEFLIGELHRRLGNFENSLQWLSKLIVTPGIDARLKTLARNQRDLIRESNSN